MTVMEPHPFAQTPEEEAAITRTLAELQSPNYLGDCQWCGQAVFTHNCVHRDTGWFHRECKRDGKDGMEFRIDNGPGDLLVEHSAYEGVVILIDEHTRARIYVAREAFGQLRDAMHEVCEAQNTYECKNGDD